MKLISFYCDIDGGSFYKDSALKLKKRCEQLQVPYLILNENYGAEWIDNVRAKPIFLLKMMKELNEDFVWLDVDCHIHKKIDFKIKKDWLFDIKNDFNPHDYVHIIKHNENNENFIRRWINEIEEQKRGSHTAFIRIHKELNFDKIPKGYFSIGHSPVESKYKYFNGKKI